MDLRARGNGDKNAMWEAGKGIFTLNSVARPLEGGMHLDAVAGCDFSFLLSNSVRRN